MEIKNNIIKLFNEENLSDPFFLENNNLFIFNILIEILIEKNHSSKLLFFIINYLHKIYEKLDLNEKNIIISSIIII